MPVCDCCGQEFEIKGEKQFKSCLVCRKEKLAGVWKRQMRFYGAAMVIGLCMLIYGVPQFQSGGFHLDDAPGYLLVMIILGGLGLMGGLFGFALAVFFRIWHGKPKH